MAVHLFYAHFGILYKKCLMELNRSIEVDKYSIQ